jgi:hypothetical protein
MMRALLAAVLWVTAIAALPAMAAEPTVLTRKDVRSLQVFEKKPHPLTLMIAGTAIGGSVSVDGIGTEIKGDSLYVYVELGPAQPRLTGTFEFSVVVPDGVRYVRFGRDGETIWSR